MLSAIFATLKGAGLSLRFYVILAAIVIVALTVGYFGVKYQSALGRVAELEEIKTQLERTNATLVEANKQNQFFISEMQADAALKEKIVNDYRIQKARDDKKLDELQKRISIAPPSDDGAVSKVLRDALIGIQTEKNGGVK